jgi:L-alanine-DL-glutamate epimerase-like enolase superfamily enzyme
MRITAVRTLQLVRPLDRPQRNSCDIRHDRRFNIVIVETDAGLTGIGDAYGDPLLMGPILERRLGPMAVGLDPSDITALWKRLFASRAFWEIGGSFLCGISAIEVACWDILGQAEGVSVCELLGGQRRQQIEAYASDLHWDEPVYMAEVAAKYVAQGFRYVKTHLGAPGERDRDLERCRAIRRAIGPDAGFMIDINTAFDRETALSRGREFADFNPFWYEEPIAPLDARGHAWLRSQLPLKIATGENLYTTYGFDPLFDCGGCDYCMPDILRCGGLEQTRQICEAAARHGVTVSPHNYSSGVGLAATLHLMAALPETMLLEFDPTQTAVYEELFTDPLIIEQGKVQVPTRPGLGVRLTDEVLEKYQSSRLTP